MNAALDEFAQNGFEKASTNQIVKNARIGKGMLFYYFQNKEELFNYLINYSFDLANTKLIEQVDRKESDFIERLKQIAHAKTEFHLTHPNVLIFLGNLFLNDNTGISDSFKNRYEQMMNSRISLLYDGIDKTLFRKDIDTEKAFKLIQWSIDGYQNELIAKLKNHNLTTINFDTYWEEFYELLDILKMLYYQNKEGQNERSANQ
ncbi:TetR/AcrR family transcriptional regulator [Lysinibacillus sp. SGAir0095]|uniref:TetR/AcrR family transcriptional regulator n=1 Tax=Lysinibacillus sp. SGAir0095 TaxID=2070463 RepID=UPI0021061809|nr:TetR/AcrR family transcriptional regulator [Lysinibacillus sp. SGAir0095]